MRNASTLLVTLGWSLAWVGLPLFFLSRCDSMSSGSGGLDTTFGLEGKVTVDFAGSHDEALGGVVLADGRIAAVGRTFNGVNYDFAIALFNTDGDLDTSFSLDGKLVVDVGADDTAYTAVQMDNGSIAMGGYSQTSATVAYFAIAVVKLDGTLDSSFSTDGLLTTVIGTGLDEIRALKKQGDGKLVAAGVSKTGGAFDMALARYTTTGVLDTSFSADGKLSQNHGSGDDQIYSLIVQDTGKYVVGGSAVMGSTTDFALARFTTDGVLDVAFGSSGKVTRAISSGDEVARTLLSDGGEHFLAVGSTASAVAMVKYTTNGALDLNYGTGLSGITVSSFTSPSMTAAGAGANSFFDIYVAGTSSSSDLAVSKFSSTGIVQGGFGEFGILATDFAGEQDDGYAIAMQSDGKAVSFGRAQVSGQFDFSLTRYTP